MIKLVPGLKYSFSTIAPNIIGKDYTGATLTGIVTHEVATKLSNVDYVHASVLPYIPDGLNKNHIEYNYYIFKTSIDNNLILAHEWINESTIKEDLDSFIDIRIHGVSKQDMRYIKSVLSLAGINTVTLLDN